MRRATGDPGLVVDATTGQKIGQHPDEISEAALTALGHTARLPLEVIRMKCRDCCCGQLAEVRKCTSVRCPLWPYRLGQRPKARRRSDLGDASRLSRKDQT